MNKKIFCAALAAIMMVSFAGCGKKDDNSGDNIASTNVTVYEAGKGTVLDSVSYNGTIVEGEYTSISAKVSAKVEEILVKEGDYVEAGTVLARLDSTDFTLAYNQARANYNSALAAYDMTANASSVQSQTAASQGLSQAQIAYNDAKLNLDRTTTLYEMGAASKVQLEAAQSAEKNALLALNSAQQNLDLQTGVVSEKTIASAKAGVDAAKATLDIAANNLNNTTIVTPSAGYVSAKNIVKGQFASPGVEIFSIKNSETVKVEINITESDIPLVAVGTETKISVKSAGAEAFRGTVSMVNPTKDQRTGLYKVHIEIPNSENKIKVGMIADVTLTLKEKKDVISIPSEAIMQEGEEFYVYLADKEGKTAVKAMVEKGVENSEMTEIIKGVEKGDKVIVKGKEFLSEKNNKIKITN